FQMKGGAAASRDEQRVISSRDWQTAARVDPGNTGAERADRLGLEAILREYSWVLSRLEGRCTQVQRESRKVLGAPGELPRAAEWQHGRSGERGRLNAALTHGQRHRARSGQCQRGRLEGFTHRNGDDCERAEKRRHLSLWRRSIGLSGEREGRGSVIVDVARGLV